MQIDIRRIYRCNKIVGTRVRNALGQDVGRLDDLVMDLEANRIAFGILAYGGFLGLGARRFAVPWEEYSLQFNEDRKQFLLDVDPSKLMQARSISHRQSLDFANPSFRREIDDVYQQIRRNRATRNADQRSAVHDAPVTDRSTSPGAQPIVREMELPHETMISREKSSGSLLDTEPATREETSPSGAGSASWTQPTSEVRNTTGPFQDRARIDTRSDSPLP